MADEEITMLCRKIYRQHKQAIDLIISNLPNQRAELREKIIELIKSKSDDLLMDDCTPGYIRFIPKTLDFPFLMCGSGWTESKRLLLFEFQLRTTSVILIIQMGPGEIEQRKSIHSFARSHPEVFQVEGRFYEKWQSLYRKPILENLDGTSDLNELYRAVESKWNEFLESDLPRIKKAFQSYQCPEAV